VSDLAFRVELTPPDIDGQPWADLHRRMTSNNPKTTRRRLAAIGQRAPTSIVPWGGTDI